MPRHDAQITARAPTKGYVHTGTLELRPILNLEPSLLKWNENLKQPSVTNLNDPPSDVDRSDCNLRLVWP